MDAQEEAYKAEACDLLVELEASLLELEEYPEDMELIGRVFRAMHTIKGSGAMFGFDAIAGFTHNVETVFDLVREGKVCVTKELIDLTLSAGDHIRDLLDAEAGGDALREAEIIAAFRQLIPNSEPGEGQPVGPTDGEAPVHGPEASGSLATYRLRFRPDPEIFARGTNPVHLIGELRELGECRVVAHTEKIPAFSDMNPEFCYLFWDIVLTTDQAENAIRDVFIFVEDECELSIERIDDGEETTPHDQACDRIGEILLKRGDLSEENLEKALERQSLLGEILVEEKATTQAAVSSALMEQDAVKKQILRRKEESLAASIRVAADKLDDLVDFVGELVIAQARLSQKAQTMNDPDLVSIAEEIEMLTGNLRDNAMSMRMLQIGSTFSTFRRLVRDLATDLGKQIELTTSGEETELDKTVIEYLKDPLVHILRNSIDHGIELPGERKDAGKEAVGTIHLAAEHSGGNVLIRISDDGRGLDSEVIRAKGIEKGLINPDSELTEKEINVLIFAPGFSTASQVSGISGRGVGMDVVKKSIEHLRGTIEVESVRGRCTTITLKLPLTLAIIEGLLVTLGEGYFIFPLTAVEECVELPRDEAEKGMRFLNIRGELVPYVRLRDEYAVNAPKPDLEQVVVMETHDQRVGVVVDRVVGSQQAVIKKMGSAFKHAPDISGATILGNGSVALIVDVNKLLELKL